MRIIAGTYRGRALHAVRDLSIRPTTDRAKQSIFDVLTHRLDFDGITVLDLFSGTGSLGLEAISRGASSVTFVDRSRTSLAVLEKNIRHLGCDDQCRILASDVFWYLKHAGQQYDLVFADPPYALPEIGEIPEAVHRAGVLKPTSYLVMEHSKESSVTVLEAHYEKIEKPFGQTTALILKRKDANEAEPHRA